MGFVGKRLTGRSREAIAAEKVGGMEWVMVLEEGLVERVG